MGVGGIELFEVNGVVMSFVVYYVFLNYFVDEILSLNFFGIFV